MRSYIFLSYSHSHEDRQVVDNFAAKLKANGVDFFRDTHSIRYGDDIFRMVRKATEKTTHFIPFISPASAESQWVFFEIGIAYSMNKRIIPRLLHSRMKLPIFLGNARYMVSAKDESKFINELLKDLKLLTGKLVRKDPEDEWGVVQPTAGACATFKPEDMLGSLTIAELNIGDRLIFEESTIKGGFRSRFVTNIRRQQDE